MSDKEIENIITEVMKQHNKELRRGNHEIKFDIPVNDNDFNPNLRRGYLRPLFEQIEKKYPDFKLDLPDSKIFELFVLALLPQFRNVLTFNTLEGKNGYELDCVGVCYEKHLTIISLCLDADEINIKEHLFEVCIHALRFGGIEGVAVLVCPNYKFEYSQYDKDENGRPNMKTVFGVRVFGREFFYENITEDNNAEFNFDNYKPNIEIFMEDFRDFITDYDEFKIATGHTLLENKSSLETTENIPLEPIMQRSQKSLSYVISLIKESCQFSEENKLVKFDECLFIWHGVKESSQEHILICRIDVPPYEAAIAKKYRKTLDQYIATALKWTGGNFRMLVFHNYDESLQNEAKTLGDFLKMRVFTLNRQEYSRYFKSKEIGIPNLIDKWVNGRLENDQRLIENIRKINKKLEAITIDLVKMRGVLALDWGNPDSTMGKEIRAIVQKNGDPDLASDLNESPKYQAIFSKKTGQIIKIIRKPEL